MFSQSIFMNSEANTCGEAILVEVSPSTSSKQDIGINGQQTSTKQFIFKQCFCSTLGFLIRSLERTHDFDVMLNLLISNAVWSLNDHMLFQVLRNGNYYILVAVAPNTSEQKRQSINVRGLQFSKICWNINCCYKFRHEVVEWNNVEWGKQFFSAPPLLLPPNELVLPDGEMQCQGFHYKWMYSTVRFRLSMNVGIIGSNVQLFFLSWRPRMYRPLLSSHFDDCRPRQILKKPRSCVHS